MDNRRGGLVSHQVHVKQPLRLFCVQILLVRVLSELVCVSAHHVHSSVVHFLVYVLVHNRCRRVPVVDVVLCDALPFCELPKRIAMFQRYITKSNQSLLSHRCSIRCFLLCGS